MKNLIFPAIFILVFALLNTYIYRRFLVRLFLSDSYRTVFLILIMGLFASQILYVMTFRFDLFYEAVYYWLGLSIGFTFMLFVVAALYDVSGLILHTIPVSGGEVTRRVRIGLDMVAIALVFFYILTGVVGGLRDPVLKEVDIGVRNLPVKEFRIVQLTDVHVGRVIRRSFVQRIVKRVNSLQPDVIVITGDLIDSEPASLQEHLEPLAELKAPAGVFFVAGNHEYIHDLNKSVRAVEELGITPLLDESVLIQDPDQQQPVLQLVGLLDYMGYRMGEGVPDPQQAFARIKTDLPVVVLAHQPVMIQKLEDYPVDLVLSGHTHGGQIFPFSLLVKLAQPYLAGLYGHDDSTRIYVSRGTGFWGPPIRVLAPSEITLLRLRPVRN